MNYSFDTTRNLDCMKSDALNILIHSSSTCISFKHQLFQPQNSISSLFTITEIDNLIYLIWKSLIIINQFDGNEWNYPALEQFTWQYQSFRIFSPGVLKILFNVWIELIKKRNSSSDNRIFFFQFVFIYTLSDPVFLMAKSSVEASTFICLNKFFFRHNIDCQQSLNGQLSLIQDESIPKIIPKSNF